MNELVSIIVPCYNQSEYMDECLNSVLNQTYENWECIIVNDGSPDNTEEVALKWQSKDSRFIYLKKENGGLSSARNFGISNARGKYILPLDCDDKIGNNYTKNALKIFEHTSNIGIVYCKAVFFGTINGKWKLPRFNKKYLLCANHIFCSAFFLKEDWSKIGGYDENMKQGWEDWEFWIRLLYLLDKTAYRLNYTGFYYRRKDISMGNSVVEDKEKKIQIHEYVYEKHKNIYIDTFGHPIQMYNQIYGLKMRLRLLDKFSQ